MEGSARGGVPVSPKAQQQQQQRGNIETCPMLNRKGSRKDRGAGQGDVDGLLECSVALGDMVAAETRRRTAARQAGGSLPHGVDDPSEEQRLQAVHATRVEETDNFQLGGPKKLTGADDPQHASQKNGGLADLWYMDDGDIMCHPILVPSLLQDFGVARRQGRSGAEPTENRSHPPCERPGCSTASVEDPRRAEHGQNLHSYRWKHHPRRRCRTVAMHRGPAPGQGRRHPRDARTHPTLPGPADSVRPPPREFWSQPYQPHPAGSWPHNPTKTASCWNLRRDPAAFSRTVLPASHGGTA